MKNKLQIEALVDNLDQVLGFVDEILEAEDCPPKVQMQIDIAVEEIFVNIAHYAYTEGVGMAFIETEIETGQSADGQEEKNIWIRFADKGIPYNPLAKPDPDVSLSIEERQIGGLGIYMVKKSMDECRYEYQEGENRFSFKKRIS